MKLVKQYWGLLLCLIPLTALAIGTVSFLDGVTAVRPYAIKSYTFVAKPNASGEWYQSGFYNAPAADTTLTIGGAVTQTHGGADVPYAAHAFAVASGAGGTDLVLTVSGTSINDLGVRMTSDSQVIVADTDQATTDQYFETPKKWLGTVTFTLTGTAGAFTFNYGYAKYDDFGNRNFTVTDFESVGLANTNDVGFNIELLHHKATGWTYSAAAFQPGALPALVDMNILHSTEKDIDAGEPFGIKRAGLSITVAGNLAEGVLSRVTTGANNSIACMDIHIGASI